MVLFNRMFKEPNKWVEPKDDCQQFYKKQVEPVILTNVHFLVSQNLRQVLLCMKFRIDKKDIEKGKWQIACLRQRQQHRNRRHNFAVDGRAII